MMLIKVKPSDTKILYKALSTDGAFSYQFLAIIADNLSVLYSLWLSSCYIQAR